MLRKALTSRSWKPRDCRGKGVAAHRPVPPAIAVADPQHGGRGDRVWRPQVVRRRPDGSQIRQHPETLLYKKSSALFGIDLAKRDIAKCHQAVVVEGYTDVMAMHLAGVTTAVASCGTAFGDEHMAMLRRLMMDDNFFRGELIYVFDGDEAGRAAALKAFAGEQHLAGQSFIAVAGDGMDPCDLRLAHGDGALRDLVARRTPLFEFAIRSALAEFDLDSAEGRVGALRRCVPMVAQIKDPHCATSTRANSPAGSVGTTSPRSSAGCVMRRSSAADRAVRLRRRPRPAWLSRPPFVPIRGIRRCGRSVRRSSRRCNIRRWPAGVRCAAGGELHPRRLRGRPRGHRRRRRHRLRRHGCRVDRCGSPARHIGRGGRAGQRTGRGGDPCRRRRQAAALYRRGARPLAGGVDRSANRRSQVETAAHVAGRARRRIPRPVRRPGGDGGLPAQPARAGQWRRLERLGRATALLRLDDAGGVVYLGQRHHPGVGETRLAILRRPASIIDLTAGCR
ncbi:toprim domain protein [Mycobacterium xenopi 3993]|nr:toprim domain protein [Mycobacterium xenopi 3993]